MADSFRVVIDSEQLEARLKSISGEEQVRIVRAAFRAGANVYRDAVEEATPERLDEGTSTSTALPPGALRSDVIISRPSAGQLEYDIKFGKYTSHVARFVDEGHRLIKGGRSSIRKGRISGSGTQIGEVQAHPFFTEAFEKATEPATTAIETTLDQQINKAFNK